MKDQCKCKKQNIDNLGTKSIELKFGKLPYLTNISSSLCNFWMNLNIILLRFPLIYRVLQLFFLHKINNVHQKLCI